MFVSNGKVDEVTLKKCDLIKMCEIMILAIVSG